MGWYPLWDTPNLSLLLYGDELKANCLSEGMTKIGAES